MFPSLETATSIKDREYCAIEVSNPGLHSALCLSILTTFRFADPQPYGVVPLNLVHPFGATHHDIYPENHTLKERMEASYKFPFTSVTLATN